MSLEPVEVKTIDNIFSIKSQRSNTVHTN